jgi:hypothetical protein
MPRHFFHVKRGQVTILDQLGELGNTAHAEVEAERLAQRVIAERTANDGR